MPQSMCKSSMSIDAAVAAQRPGYALERPFYTDPAIFDAEIDHVFFRSWWLVGHVSEIPHPGDFFLFPIAAESIIVLRRSPSEIVALFNVCRHRGSRICLQATGHVNKLVCPYHAWVYDTDGSLLSARLMPDDFDPSQHGLHAASVRVVEGMIFICPGDDPPDFSAAADAIHALFRFHEMESAKVCAHETLRLKCNWKVAAENSWECYHCSPSHKEYCSVMAHATAFESDRRQAEQTKAKDEWHALVRRLGHPIPDPNKKWPSDLFVNAAPIGPGRLTQSQDGKPVAPLMGRFKEFDGGLRGFMTYPIIWVAASNDHALLTRFTPLGPVDTEVRYSWLVRADVREGIDFQLDRVTWLWRTTGAQDKEICENNQAGIASLRYEPGPYSTAEATASGFVQWYLDRMRPEGQLRST
jgi:Rieske 2Fe-2S family protein